MFSLQLITPVDCVIAAGGGGADAALGCACAGLACGFCSSRTVAPTDHVCACVCERDLSVCPFVSPSLPIYKVGSDSLFHTAQDFALKNAMLIYTKAGTVHDLKRPTCDDTVGSSRPFPSGRRRGGSRERPTRRHRTHPGLGRTLQAPVALQRGLCACGLRFLGAQSPFGSHLIGFPAPCFACTCDVN